MSHTAAAEWNESVGKFLHQKGAMPKAQVVHQEQRNLEVVNRYIESHGSPNLELNKLLFQVEKDGIDWSSGTAQRMFDSWCDQLNY
ncbi:uncharacterized protein DAT39_001590 [Clarias magur]|uniref:Uncharacterized protein n=1 Tax=Clarias magur TaxID=1594786 RepID=A0A8J4U7Y2_CLAMG|nr:uncharacterized protein DAT39_001590 [Clarias magur]